jgi:AmmeMemoRadiSam system protein A
MAAPVSHELGGDARRWLLEWARRVIRAYLSGEAEPEPAQRPPEVDARRPCFVSLHTGAGELRGCIGTFDDGETLWETVSSMAIAAATRDPRFAPVRSDEVADVVIEISALTPRAPIRADDVVVGKHGLWVSRGGRHGVLLPQVPEPYGWDRVQFLEHTCAKAGLPRHAWKDPETLLEAFEAEVFSEEPHAGG